MKATLPRPLHPAASIRSTMALFLIASLGAGFVSASTVTPSLQSVFDNLKSSYTVRMGKPLVIPEASGLDPNLFIADPNEFVAVTVEGDGRIRLTGRKPGSTALTFRYGESADVAQTRLIPDIRVVDVSRIRVNNLDPEQSILVNKPLEVQVEEVEWEDGMTFEDAIVQIAVTPEANGAVTVNKTKVTTGQQFRITASKITESPVSVSLSCLGFTRTFSVRAVDPIQTITVKQSTIALREGATAEIEADVVTFAGTTWKAADRKDLKLVALGTNDLVDIVSPTQIRARSLGANPAGTRVSLELRSTSTPPVVAKQPIEVTVNAAQGYVSVKPAVVRLLPDDSVVVRGSVHQRTGSIDPEKQVRWVVADPRDENYVGLAPEGDSVTIYRKAGPEIPPGEKRLVPSHVVVKAFAPEPGKVTADPAIIETTVLVKLSEVAKFSPVSVRLDIMDDQTAEDLYGRKTRDEYFVARVRIFNNLIDDETGENVGSSILAFSDSIEVAVGLERMYDRKSKSVEGTGPDTRRFAANDGKWHPVEKVDLDLMIDPYFGKRKVVADPPLKTGDDEGRTVLQRTPVAPRDEPDNPCVNAITYRPFSFEMIVNTVDRRDERSTRARVFKGLALFGTAASFVTAIGIPGGGSDLPTSLEKYSNLFIPGLAKVFPSLKETHRQNIVSQAMKPIEEIPFGSDISRVIFLPRRGIRGLLPGQLVRICTVCPYYFKIQVAVLRKDGKSVFEQGTADSER